MKTQMEGKERIRKGLGWDRGRIETDILGENGNGDQQGGRVAAGPTVATRGGFSALKWVDCLG